MSIAKVIVKCARSETCKRSYHIKEKGIGGDVEGDAEEEVGAALVKLAAQFAVAHVELKKGVAGGERHLVELADVPRADDEPAAVGVGFDLRNDLVDLVDAPAIGRAPVAPLRAVHAAEVAVFIRPLIPDRNIVVSQISGARVTT